MKDKSKLLKMLEEWNVPFKIYTDLDCIADEAVKAKAVDSISILDGIDLAFDKDGTFLGSYNNSANSWVKRRKK